MHAARPARESQVQTRERGTRGPDLGRVVDVEQLAAHDALQTRRDPVVLDLEPSVASRHQRRDRLPLPLQPAGQRRELLQPGEALL